MNIQVKVAGHFVEIKLDRPQARNSFNPEMIKDLTTAFRTISKDRNLRAVILSGEGSVFCAGADLEWMKSMIKFSYEQNLRDAEILFQLFESMAECPLPVIGKVQGAAYGGALGLLANCDYVVAEKDAMFCFSEVKLGIAPAVISPFIARKCKIAHAKPYMLNATVMNSELAQRVGLVDEIVTGLDALNLATKKYAESFLSCGPEAVRETKKMLQEIPLISWEEQKSMTTQLIAERRVSQEGQEGISSFLEKRKARWSLN